MPPSTTATSSTSTAPQPPPHRSPAGSRRTSTVSDAAAALDWYAEAFGAEEQFRVVGDDGRLGHAEFTIGAARFMLSDEYPEIGVRLSDDARRRTGLALHLR